MPRRIAVNTLNASTIDILNVIRQNASYEYQSSVPVITQATDIPKVGEVIYGTPALANQFLNALINRIAQVRVESAVFNNPYARVKKGMVEYGETVEEIFVNIAKAVTYDPESAAAREFQRNIPDVRSAFHVINWRVMYPVTIQDEDLKLAFLSIEGVQNLIAKIVDAVYTAAEYDDFLLTKYLIIKGVTHGNYANISLGADPTATTAAIAFRGISNLLPFMSSKYNAAGVKTTTPKGRQLIFMDAIYNAQYDVEVLASAFNMDKATFMGSLYLIDNFTTFDNERFDVIRSQSDGLEEITEDELAIMKNVKAIMVDENWFQIYDNKNQFTEKYVASGLYWNYFYHVWRTVSYSPFSNAVVFGVGTVSIPATLTAVCTAVDTVDEATIFTFELDEESASFVGAGNFVQTESFTEDGIAVQKYGVVIYPASQRNNNTQLLQFVLQDGTVYNAATPIIVTSTAGGGAAPNNTTVGSEITLNKQA